MGPTHEPVRGRSEVLDSGAGGAWNPPPPPRSPGNAGSGRRKGLIAGGALVALAAVVGGGLLAYNVYLASGPQPSEALPASTVAYLSVNLDPSGKQKLAALDALEKFPAFADNTGVGTRDDLREKLFTSIQGDGICPDLSYDDDIAPWLGDRLGVAAVDLGDDNGDRPVTPVVVLQVTDAGQADTGLKALRDCGVAGATGADDSLVGDPTSEESATDDFGGWSIQGEWVVLAETTELAQKVTDAAADAPLTDDDTYNTWIDAAGEEGIVTAYVSPAAGDLIAQAVTGLGLIGSSETCAAVATPVPSPSPGTDPFGDDDPYADYPSADDCQLDPLPAPEMQQGIDDALADFDGLAVKVRFADGSLEVESAGGTTFPGLEGLGGSDRGDDVVATLPADTAAAFGFGFEPGWGDDLINYLDSAVGDLGVGHVDELISEAEAQSGLTLPDDLETLAGESAAISVGSNFDAKQVQAAGPSELPVGVTIEGDTDAITAVLDTLLGNADVPADMSGIFGYDTDGDHVAVGPLSDYRAELLAGGDLGDDDTYREVMAESENASAVLYVNFNANDWLVNLVGAFNDDPELAANLEPLGALGLSSWTDGDGSHSLLKLTTD